MFIKTKREKQVEITTESCIAMLFLRAKKKKTLLTTWICYEYVIQNLHPRNESQFSLSHFSGIIHILLLPLVPSKRCYTSTKSNGKLLVLLNQTSHRFHSLWKVPHMWGGGTGSFSKVCNLRHYENCVNIQAQNPYIPF